MKRKEEKKNKTKLFRLSPNSNKRKVDSPPNENCKFGG